jgi:Phospholipase A2-like domain
MSVQIHKNRGRGVINRIIDALPVEVHIPGFNFCGPGTKLEERLRRGDVGVNKLDEECKAHDIVYASNSDKVTRAEADKKLENAAWERVKAKDAKLGEKTAAWLTTNIMKAKRALSGGCISCSTKPWRVGGRAVAKRIIIFRGGGAITKQKSRGRRVVKKQSASLKARFKSSKRGNLVPTSRYA